MSITIKETRGLMCHRCSYSWDTKSVLDFVTCPNCSYKVNAKNCEQKKCSILISELLTNAYDAFITQPPFNKPKKHKEKRWEPRGFRPGRWEALK